ncbi:hypothetical protein vBValCWD615_6 [Vibrio phage vB_ValC_WD615]|nr:hypothetical protein vBValCWD615_6 [Vibrio phage vB_ValC_WD615]
MNLDSLSAMAANHALVNMITKKDYFDICTLDKILRNLGIQAQCGQSYAILDSLHCLYYKDMPKELRRSIPELIQNVVGIDAEYYESEPEPEYKPKRLSISFFK